MARNVDFKVSRTKLCRFLRPYLSTGALFSDDEVLSREPSSARPPICSKQAPNVIRVPKLGQDTNKRKLINFLPHILFKNMYSNIVKINSLPGPLEPPHRILKLFEYTCQMYNFR